MKQYFKKTILFALVAALAVVIVIPTPLTAIDPMVTVPVAGPFMSALQKLTVPAAAAAAEVTSNPVGNVRKMLPPSGIEVFAKNSTL